MTPTKLTVPGLSGLLRANLVTQLRFYGHFKCSYFFVVLIRPLLVQMCIAKRAQVKDVLKKFGRKKNGILKSLYNWYKIHTQHLNSMTRPTPISVTRIQNMTCLLCGQEMQTKSSSNQRSGTGIRSCPGQNVMMVDAVSLQAVTLMTPSSSRISYQQLEQCSGAPTKPRISLSTLESLQKLHLEHH